jgi:hypothetical protein
MFDQAIQLPALFRRGIVAPLDAATEAEMRTWFLTYCARVEFLPIHEDGMFEALWEAGVFRRINSACGSFIDDYEEDIIEASSLHCAIDGVKSSGQDCAHAGLLPFQEHLISLMERARHRGQPVFFIL